MGWAEFQKLPAQDFVVDISCVTKWTKLDTRWRGVSVDTLLESVELDPRGGFATAYSDGGYTTNLRLPDVVNGKRSSHTSTTAHPSTLISPANPAKLVAMPETVRKNESSITGKGGRQYQTVRMTPSVSDAYTATTRWSCTAAEGASGIRAVARVPCRGRDSMRISPPCRSTIQRAIGKPRPLPDASIRRAASPR
jgi:hypothetical protein